MPTAVKARTVIVAGETVALRVDLWYNARRL